MRPRPAALLLALALAAGLVSGCGPIIAAIPPTAVPPTAAPTEAPTVPPAPSPAPTATVAPTVAPTVVPTQEPAPPAPATVAPTEAPTAAPSQTPAPLEIVGYAGHLVAEGETLAQIAANGGSTPALISAYNRLGGPPQPGRALIVPRLAGEAAALPNEPIMVTRGPATRPWVALTLDAGASAEPTPRMLDALRERGVRVTFFLTGKWIAAHPELVRRIIDEGHELASHTYGHPDLTTLDDDAIRRELADTEAALRAVAPEANLRPLFRPPFGSYDERVQRVVQAAGYLPVYWTLDSLDSVGEPKTPDFLLQRVTAKLTPEELRGAIILAHCGSEPTADALPAILDRFAELGLEVRTLSEVLAGG